MDERPVIKLVNAPNPEPSAVLLSAIVGMVLVELQHTPRAVTASPPSEVTSPPAVAEFTVMDETAAAVMVGSNLGVSFLQQNKTNNSNPMIATDKILELDLIVSSLVAQI